MTIGVPPYPFLTEFYLGYELYNIFLGTKKTLILSLFFPKMQKLILVEGVEGV